MAGDFDSSQPVYTRADGDVVAGIVDSTNLNRWDITATGQGQVVIEDSDGTDSLAIFNEGDAITGASDGGIAIMCEDPSGNAKFIECSANGLKVDVVAITDAEETDFVDYATVVDLAINTPTDVHTYTPGALRYVERIYVAGRGEMKVNLEHGLTLTPFPSTISMQYNSVGDRNVTWNFRTPLQVTSLETIIIEVTNLENGAAKTFDVHSAIFGHS